MRHCSSRRTGRERTHTGCVLGWLSARRVEGVSGTLLRKLTAEQLTRPGGSLGEAETDLKFALWLAIHGALAKNSAERNGRAPALLLHQRIGGGGACNISRWKALIMAAKGMVCKPRVCAPTEGWRWPWPCIARVCDGRTSASCSQKECHRDYRSSFQSFLHDPARRPTIRIAAP